MNFRKLVLGSFSILALATLGACDDDDSGATTTTSSGTGGSSTTTGQGGSGGQGGGGMSMSTLTVTLAGLEPLGSDYVYEGWFILSDGPVSTGRFSVVTGTDTYESMVPTDEADAAMEFVLTIEPAQNDDPAPSAVHVLAGDMTSGSADLTIGHASALGTAFAAADMSGSYILNTPTTGSDDTDYDQGIWWLTVGTSGPEVSLTLPTLPTGWVYEGWIVDASGPVSTGRFTMAAGEDSDDKGPTAGPDGYPDFPGQDYISPAVVLTGLTAVISVEPEPDDSPTPFAIKPLVDADIEDVGIGVDQSMANMSANNPTGMAVVTAN